MYGLQNSQAFPTIYMHPHSPQQFSVVLNTCSSRLRGGGRLYLHRASALEHQSPKASAPQPIRRPVVELEASAPFTGRASIQRNLSNPPALHFCRICLSSFEPPNPSSSIPRLPSFPATLRQNDCIPTFIHPSLIYWTLCDANT